MCDFSSAQSQLASLFLFCIPLGSRLRYTVININIKFATLSVNAYVKKSKINSAKTSYLQWGLNLGPLVIDSDAFLTEQVLIKGYLTSLSLVHQLTLDLYLDWLYKDLKSLSLTSNVKLAQSGRHETVTQAVPCSIHTRGAFFPEFCSSYISLYCQLRIIRENSNKTRHPSFS